MDAFPRPAIFSLIQERAGVVESEMRRTFNCALGLVLAAAKENADAVSAALRDAGESVFTIGEVIETPGAVDDERVRFA